jgi:predicted helicase
VDASASRRAPRQSRKPLRQLIAAMSRVVGEVRDRGESPVSGISADDFAQMIVCGLVTVLAGREYFLRAAPWLLNSAPVWQRVALREVFSVTGLLDHASDPAERVLTERQVAELRQACGSVDWSSPLLADLEAEHLYERFLAFHAADQRRRKGVFFTPRPIVRFMLEQVDRQIREEFGFAKGLADAEVLLVDPAAGAGAFLTEAVSFIHERFCESQTQDADWSQYVAEQLLPRLTGIELMPTSCLLAHLHLAIRLAKTGFDFERDGAIRVSLGNALLGPNLDDQESEGRANDRCVVVLGNPPFSYLSENESPWIQGLIRGENGAAGYLEFDGERLGERKTWLHDDYVKFLRYAQWRVETVGSGIVAFVTNHGYLDNATFRILRRQLMRAFPRIAVIDLHGNRKKGERSPTGERDENVFGLDQGVAIGLFRTTASEAASSGVEHAELWGSVDAKLAALTELSDRSPGFSSVEPQPPDYAWVPRSTVGHPEYLRGISLPEAMPVYTTAPVTARDGLVVAFTRDELLRRMERFCDLRVPDEVIRRELFPQARTARYPAGDTRGWKLTEARRRLAAEGDLQPFVRRCLYRPFDWRYVLWHEAMIDWPRTAVMRHLLDGSQATEGETAANLALIARRQMLPSQPCAYFWVTDTLTLDGVIRNDNRGSEAVFPQWLLGESATNAADRRLNLAESLTATDASSDFLFWAYALFHAPGYRERYADELRRGFPRVMLPRREELRSELASFGRRLVELHLLRGVEPQADSIVESGNHSPLHVAARFPQYADGAVWVAPGSAIARCTPAAWEFRAGGHQALRKWLADRRGRSLTPEDLRTYGQMVAAIEQTLAFSPAIDESVLKFGGWEQAFR